MKLDRCSCISVGIRSAVFDSTAVIIVGEEDGDGVGYRTGQGEQGSIFRSGAVCTIFLFFTRESMCCWSVRDSAHRHNTKMNHAVALPGSW